MERKVVVSKEVSKKTTLFKFENDAIKIELQKEYDKELLKKLVEVALQCS